jgi:hypothetical protein
LTERNQPPWAGLAAIAYGAGFALVVVIVGVVVGGAVPDPAALLADVTRHQGAWVASQVVLAAQQVLLVPIVIGLLFRFEGGERTTVAAGAAFLGVAGIAFLASGVIHGALGAHLGGRTGSVAIAETELVHAIGDTFWFAGIGGLALAVLVLAGPIRRSPHLPSGLAALGVVAAVCDGLALLWFFVPDIGFAGALGDVLHAAWFVWLGGALLARPVAPAIP